MVVSPSHGWTKRPGTNHLSVHMGNRVTCGTCPPVVSARTRHRWLLVPRRILTWRARGMPPYTEQQQRGVGANTRAPRASEAASSPAQSATAVDAVLAARVACDGWAGGSGEPVQQDSCERQEGGGAQRRRGAGGCGAAERGGNGTPPIGREQLGAGRA